MCDQDNCNCGQNPCCGDCEPLNCIEQAVNDIWATKEGQIEDLVERAETAATNSEASAEASAGSAAESKEFRDEAELAASTAVAAEGIVLGVANTLQATADKLEQIADELGTAIAGVAVSTWYYTTIAENQTVIPVPESANAVDVQSIYIEGTRQEPNRGFVFNKTTMEITLAEGLPLGLEIAIILGTYNSDNPNDFSYTLASDNGAGLVGTLSGKTVQEELNQIETALDNIDSTLRTDLAKSTGAGLVGWKRTILADAVTNVDKMLSAQNINVWEYADLITNKPTADNPNTWDWTPAFQAAIDSLDTGALNPGVSGGCIFVPAMTKNMIYRITELVFPLSICLFGQGVTIAPFDYTQTHTHLMKFMGMNKVIGVQISMDYSMTYGCAIWCRGRNLDFSSGAVWFSTNAVQVGEPTWATDPATAWLGDSEISFSNFQFNWCLKTCTAYGLNTILVFGAGCRCYSNRGAIPASHPNATAWAAAPMGNFHNYGALIYVVGAFIGTFSRDVPSMTSYPVNTTTTDYLPTYGRYTVDGTHIETSYLFYAPAPSGFTVTDDTTCALTLSNAQGHVATSPTDLYWINCSSSLKQKILISPTVSFYGSAGVTPTRTKLISAPGCLVDIPLQPSCFPCISGEIKDACNIIYPTNKNGLRLVTAFGSTQTIGTTASTLIMPSFGTIDLVSAARATYYSTTTGVFTAGVELRDVEIIIDLRYVTPASGNTVTLNLVVSGAVVDSVVASGAYSRVVLKTRRVAKGATFIVTMVGSASYVLDGTANTKVNMNATV